MHKSRKYSTEVIVDFDNLFHFISRSSQKLLEVLISYVEDNSPFGHGDCSITCAVGAVYAENKRFRDAIEQKAGMTYGDMMEHMQVLDQLGYVQIEDRHTLELVITCKGWMGSIWWEDTRLLEIADNEAGDGWDWDNILPLAPSALATEIIERLDLFRSRNHQ